MYVYVYMKIILQWMSKVLLYVHVRLGFSCLQCKVHSYRLRNIIHSGNGTYKGSSRPDKGHKKKGQNYAGFTQ